MRVWGYPGASFGRRSEGPTRAERYLADKAALMRAQRYYTPEEFAQLLADLQDERISLRVYEDGIVIDLVGDLATAKPRRPNAKACP